jgi:YegS/Rv2252/BmrU family lipid kinase
MKILLVFNPHAANGRVGSLLPGVLAAFSEAGVEVDLRSTVGPGHATRLVAEAAFDDCDGVVAAGGDGTLFEVLNGYYLNRSPRRVPLGVLPVGTGNAFARDLDVASEKWREAVAVIAVSRTRKFDVGRFTVEGRTLYYLNILGVGFVADVVDSASRMKILGNVSYTIGVLLRTIALKSYHVRIEADGTVVEGENIFTEISNTRWTSNFLMAPEASIEDGFLDVTMLGRMSRRRLLSCFPLIFTGAHVTLPEVRTFKARSIRISTDAPKVLTPDGELVGATPVHIECLPRDVEVFSR